MKNKAFERAKAAYGTGAYDDATLEFIFPELAESEDERIRKAIIHYILYETKGTISEATEHTWVKWLEKQKEPVVDKEGMYYYLGGKFIYCGYPATEENPYDFAMSQQEKQKDDRMKPIYDARESFESALEKAWNDYHNGYENVDKLEDDYVECAHAKGFREGFLFGVKKQKENPKSADSIPSDCTSDAKCKYRWHKVGDSLPDNGRLVLAKDCLGNVLLARYDGENWEVNMYDNEDHYCHNSISKWCEIPSEKQKEQKPVDLSDMMVHKEPYIAPVPTPMVADEQKPAKPSGKLSRQDYLYQLLIDQLITYSDYEYLIGQKPAEWSEDSINYKEGFKTGRETGLRDGQKYVLDNLESYGLCKPAEWSEEEAKKAAEDYADEYPGMTHENDGSTIEDYDKPYNDFMAGVLWAKHHGIFQNGNTHWKPSEEQMEALSWLVDYVAPSEKYIILIKNLYEQLKKL